MRLGGMSAIVTGAASGLGEATVGTPMPSPSSTMAYADPNRGPPPTTLGAQARAMGTGAPQPQVVASAAPSQEIAPSTGTKPVAHSGWIIQVGALESESEARQRLNEARGSASKLLGDAEQFTETVSKGRKTLYRARFAGLNQDSAEAACRTLKRSDISCIAIRN